MAVNHKLLEEARKAVDDLWEKANLKSRPWPMKKENNSKSNPYAPCIGSNIMILMDEEIILITLAKGGQELLINEFSKTPRTSLGNAVRRILKEKSLPFID